MTYKMQRTFHLTVKAYWYLDSTRRRDDDRPSPFGLVKPRCCRCRKELADCGCSTGTGDRR